MSPPTPRCRLRNFLPGLHLGSYPPGPLNSLTDVPGVLAHTKSIHLPVTPNSGAANTGVTTILPHCDFFHRTCYASLFQFNGSGKLTGSHWIEETRLFHSPILLTNSFTISTAQPTRGFISMRSFTVKLEYIIWGIDAVSVQRVKEGNTRSRGGTGMANYGRLEREVEEDEKTKVALEELEKEKNWKDGGIIAVLATDMPLHSLEISVQMVTANKRSVDPWKPMPMDLQVLDDDQTINALFEAAADATEEAIYNALCMAETMVGVDRRVVETLPLDRVKGLVEKYGYLNDELS
ncbi:peptidase family T4 protein [Lasiosphaeria ovina]|uniref:Peptidase family T4 protein n=1 Tax=Lasiosphaeria ovina TaxID=92902 RepID=A0AAE0K924_9PEZI|nr:peptidase family T4 protein [Lasiosphaeria ovina]